MCDEDGKALKRRKVLWWVRRAARREQYLTTFLRQFNAGHRKSVVPLWLKAPGGQWFYWGKLPRFKGQEPIEELVVHYREQYFDGERIHLLIDQPVKTLRL